MLEKCLFTKAGLFTTVCGKLHKSWKQYRVKERICLGRFVSYLLNLVYLSIIVLIMWPNKRYHSRNCN